MAFTHMLTVRSEYQDSETNSRSIETYTHTAGLAHVLSVPFVNSDADKLVELNIDISQLQCIVIHADQPMTLETNDGTTPDDTFGFLAGDMIDWSTSSPEPNPFTADITALYVTANGDEDGTLTIYALEDPTV